MQKCCPKIELDCIQLTEDNVNEVLSFTGFDIDNTKDPWFINVTDKTLEYGLLGTYKQVVEYGDWLVFQNGYHLVKERDFDYCYSLL